MIKRIPQLMALVLMLLTPLASAQDQTFIISDIRVEGLQRISAGSVFASLPVGVGDMVDARAIRRRETGDRILLTAPCQCEGSTPQASLRSRWNSSLSRSRGPTRPTAARPHDATPRYPESERHTRKPTIGSSTGCWRKLVYKELCAGTLLCESTSRSQSRRRVSSSAATSG